MHIFKIFSNIKLQYKLLISFTTVFVVSIVVVIAAFYYNSANSLREEVVNYSTLYLSQLNENLNTYLDELDRLTAMTLADRQIQRILEKNTDAQSLIDMKSEVDYMEDFLFNIYTLNPDIKNIIVIGKNGLMYSEGEARYSHYKVDANEYAWYKDAKRSKGKVMIYTKLRNENAISTADTDKYVSLVRKISNIENGSFIGCIRIDVLFSTVEEIVWNVGNVSSMDILISDREYNILFDPNNTIQKINIPKYAQAFEIAKEEKNGAILADLKDKNDIVVFRSSDYTGWTILGIVSSKALMTMTQRVKNMSIIVVIVTTIIIVILCILISLGITNRLKKLSTSMKIVEAGEFNVNIKDFYLDEIGDITRSFNIMICKIRELIDKEYNLEIKRKEAELKALQAQINPHFLYNTLETLRMKAVVSNNREIANMIKMLSRFFKLNIIRDNEIVMVREELEHVKCYMDIQNIRYNNRFKFTEDFDSELLDAQILKLTLQPLIENAIFHGLEPKAGQCFILLRGQVVDDNMVIKIMDNGVGISEERLKELEEVLDKSKASDKLGIGVNNVHKRIKYHFGADYGIKILSSVGKGTSIEINMPFLKYPAVGDDIG